MSYKENTMKLWRDTAECSCGKQDCNTRNHKKCPICGGTMMYGSHYSIEKLRKSDYAWNVDMIVQKCDGGNSKYSNLRAVHIKCNRSKNRKDQSGEY